MKTLITLLLLLSLATLAQTRIIPFSTNPTVAGGGGGPEILFTANAETGDLTQLSSTYTSGGATTIVATAGSKYAGTYGYELTMDGTSQAELQFTSLTRDTIYTSFYVMIDPDWVSAASTAFLAMGVQIGWGERHLLLNVDCDGDGIPYRWAINYLSGGWTTTTTNFSLGEWHHVETRSVTGTGADAIHQLWIDDTLLLDVSDGTLSSNIDTYWCGAIATSVTAGNWLYFDNIVIGVQ